jgi:hypothetical protein
VNLLGPVNELIKKIEDLFPIETETFYRKLKISKSGNGIGGTLNGPFIKDILKETNLTDLMETLPSEASAFVTFLRSIREVHVLCTEDSLDPNFLKKNKVILTAYMMFSN